MSRRVEWSVAEWDARPARLAHVRPPHVHEKHDDPFCRVFVCRAPGGRFACGRYFGACFGGDDNRCADCSNKAWRDLKRRIVAFVKDAKSSRGEIAICQRFGGCDEHAPVEDALHELVQEKKIFWFGSSEKPLRYVTYERRAWAKREEKLSEARSRRHREAA